MKRRVKFHILLIICLLLLFLFFLKQNINLVITDKNQQLVDLNNFQYVIKKDRLCDNSDPLLLLVIISSAAGNVEKRDTIRQTWGQKRDNIRLVFNLGLSDQNTNAAIKIEDSQHQDIIQGNFMDSYKNMTYKSTLAVKYAAECCPSAKFVLKCDDDVFVNTPLLLNFLKYDIIPFNVTNSIFCNVNGIMPVIRDAEGRYGKWYVSYEQYPEQFYPEYCSGMFAIMTSDVALNLYRNAQKTTFFWIEDVFLTGIVAKKIWGLRFVNIINFTLVKTDVMSIGTSDLTFLFGGVDMSNWQINFLWEYVSSRSVKRSVFNILIT
ncbi:lactosylceramide 1,3-N-acetyl-beta-D-glucosaminyltransferase-like [Anthonomus grandis grandis]|uniref:lactosylceramide 1,3-N-acetyl-beta-D-glucosaminyltransferase-like n=1 Tax=Anthonomus grandis grandis TaxID=2921223 RepID=UPI002165599B|nr:lactosylceramide 1,3-N-acetyl-beta-D-glucosaminyltransferase-like [Anthonomus grandis grandis]